MISNSLKRAIDYLAIEDADVCNELERGVDQISLQLVAHAFDVDPYVLLGRVWDRHYAWWLGLHEPVETHHHTVTDAGVFQVMETATGRYWVVVIENPQYYNVSEDLGLFQTSRAAMAAIRQYTAKKNAA